MRTDVKILVLVPPNVGQDCCSTMNAEFQGLQDKINDARCGFLQVIDDLKGEIQILMKTCPGKCCTSFTSLLYWNAVRYMEYNFVLRILLQFIMPP